MNFTLHDTCFVALHSAPVVCTAGITYDEPNAVVNQESGGTLSGYPIAYIVKNGGANVSDPHEPILNASYDSGLVYADHAAALTALNAGTYTSTATSTLFMRVIREDGVALTNPFPYLLDGFFPLDNQGNDTSPKIPFHDGQPYNLLTSISGQLCKLEIYGSLEKSGCTNQFQWFSPTFEWYYYVNCPAPTLTAPNLRIEWAGSVSAGWTPSLISETASVTLNADIHIRLTQGSYNLLYGNAAASDEAIISIGDIQNGYDLSTLDSSLSNLANCQQNINLTARIVPVIDCNHGTPNWPISKVWDWAEEESATETHANCVGTNIDATDCTSGATVTFSDPNGFGPSVGMIVPWWDNAASAYKCATVTSVTSGSSPAGQMTGAFGGVPYPDCATCQAAHSGLINFDATDCTSGATVTFSDPNGFSPSVGMIVEWWDNAASAYKCATVTSVTSTNPPAGHITGSPSGVGYTDCATCQAARSQGSNIDATDCTSGATVTLNDPYSYGVNVGDIVSWYDGNAATYACGTVTSTTSSSSVSFAIDNTGYTDCADCNSYNGIGGGGGGGGSSTNFEVTDCNDGSIWVLNDSYGYSPSIGDIVDWYDPNTGYPHCGTITATTADPESTYISYTHSDCTECNDYHGL